MLHTNHTCTLSCQGWKWMLILWSCSRLAPPQQRKLACLEYGRLVPFTTSRSKPQLSGHRLRCIVVKVYQNSFLPREKILEHLRSQISFTLSWSLRVRSLSLFRIPNTKREKTSPKPSYRQVLINMSQYQQHIPRDHPQDLQNPQYSLNSYQAQSSPSQQSYDNAASYPSQSTFPPQSYNSPRMEQPQATYQAPQQMSEKPQAQAPVQAQAHNHPKNGFGNKWLFGLFDCCSPLDTCCLGFWCSCKSNQYIEIHN